jgi:hypothetical protein
LGELVGEDLERLVEENISLTSYSLDEMKKRNLKEK